MNITFDMPQEMRSKYLSRRAEDARKLRAALRERDLNLFRELGLQISATAANYGFPQLEIIAGALVTAADSKSATDQDKALDEFADCLVMLNAAI